MTFHLANLLLHSIWIKEKFILEYHTESVNNTHAEFSLVADADASSSIIF